MERWILYAILSMLCAGVTAIFSKLALSHVNSEFALVIRSGLTFLLIALFATAVVPKTAMTLPSRNLMFLVCGAIASAASLVFYFKAIQQGEVSTVALIDKGSFLVAVLLAWLVLGEAITLRTLAGCGLILAGVIVVARR